MRARAVLPYVFDEKLVLMVFFFQMESWRDKWSTPTSASYFLQKRCLLFSSDFKGTNSRTVIFQRLKEDLIAVGIQEEILAEFILLKHWGKLYWLATTACWGNNWPRKHISKCHQFWWSKFLNAKMLQQGTTNWQPAHIFFRFHTNFDLMNFSPKATICEQNQGFLPFAKWIWKPANQNLRSICESLGDWIQADYFPRHIYKPKVQNLKAEMTLATFLSHMCWEVWGQSQGSGQGSELGHLPENNTQFLFGTWISGTEPSGQVQHGS